MPSSAAFQLISRPQGDIVPANLKKVESPVPSEADIADGQCLIKNLYLSIDPTHRIWMSDKPQYMPCVELGETMRAASIGIVEVSKCPEKFPVGSKVYGFGGIAEYYVGIPNVNLMYKIPENIPITANLSVCSVIIGLCAWHGMNKILSPKAGDVVVVSAAAGAVGSLAAQLAKLAGAKVIGIAGGPEKCAWLTDTLKLDHAIDYKFGDVGAKLKEILGSDPLESGITHYLDNVGGSITDAVLLHCKNNAKFAICGSITEYNDQWEGLKNTNMILMRRISVQGYICMDHMDEWGECLGELSKLVNEGKVVYKEHIVKGMDTYVDTVNLLFSGKNTGKLIIEM